MPAENLLCLRGVCVNGGKVARAAFADDIRNLHAVDRGEGVHHFQNAYAFAGAEVEDFAACVRFRIAERGKMPFGKVHDVDVVAHAGAVGGIVGVAEDGQLLELADRDLRDIGHEVIRNTVRIFTDQTGFMRADRVKIAKQDHMQLGICLCRVLQNFLDHELRPAVGIRAMPGVGGLGERCGLIAVDRRGRREDEFFAAEFLHDFENAQAGIEIVAVIGKRQADRFADSLEPCKVNDAGDGALGKNVAQRACRRHQHCKAPGVCR